MGRSGVYVIEQVGTDRCYVGSSRNMRTRWAAHRKLLGRGRHHSSYLQHAWSKHGEAAFRFGVLREVDPPALLIVEQEYIDRLKPAFNLCPLARSRLGSRQREEVRAKVAAIVRARAARITHCPRGHAYDEANTYINAKGKRICRACSALRVSASYAAETPEQREARRVRVSAYAGRGRARRWSPEHRAKLSAANLGRPISVEARVKMRAAKIGRPLSAEHRAKISAAQRSRR